MTRPQQGGSHRAPAVSPTDLIQTLANLCGIGPEVAELLADRNLVPGGSLAPMLIRARKRLGITMSQMHRRSGITRSQLLFYEKGSHLPNARTALQLAKHYGLPVELVLQATLRDSDLLKASAPGAPVSARNRKREPRPRGPNADGADRTTFSISSI